MMLKKKNTEGLYVQDNDLIGQMVGCILKHINHFGLVSFFNGISTFVGYLMPKPFSTKNSSGTI